MSVEIRIEVNQLFNAALLPRDTGKLLVDRLTIINDEIPRNGLIIKISTTPYILELKVPYYIDYLNPNERFEISLDALTDIDLSSLMDLPESYISKLQILLYDDSYNVIASSDVYNIKLLTCNTWPGICKNNNVIAAFLVNTQPSIIEFKNQAFAIITKDADVTERLDLVLSEMYNLDVCVSELPYGYIYRPYKFKIYDELKQNCTCTSMDLALAIATLAESVGLSVVVAFFEYGPIVGILKNKKRNVVGCYERWIEELESKNILCIVPENTIAKENKACDLIDHVPESRGNFLFVVDVDNARTTISPISFRLIEHGIRSYISQWEPFHNSRAKIPIRFQKWEGDLLDLTLRNNLLDLGKKVFDGESDSLIIKSKGIIPLKVQDNDSLLKIQKSFLVGNVHALKARASDLDYSSKSSCLLWMDEKYRENIDVIISGCKKIIKDSGQNNTYIAMGLVEWYDSNDVMHIAPLTLLSVRISSDWRITHNDIEDVETNIILLEK